MSSCCNSMFHLSPQDKWYQRIVGKCYKMTYPKTKKDNNRPMDRISNLPTNLIESILMLLPLRDAARTSILSKKWRFYWLKLPQLVFDDTLIRDSKKNKISLQSKLHKTIYQVLLHHRGPIVKFTLSISELESCVWIYELIVLFLSRNCIRELTLYIQKGNSYRLPPTLFSCPQLRELKLSNCIFEPPPRFNGFSRIVSLEFHSVYFDIGVLRRLVSSCPRLEQLKIGRNIDCGYLEIDAPNLNFLSINARFGSIHFKNVPLLAVVSITTNYDNRLEKPQSRLEKSAMIEVFRSLPVIETLQLGNRFVKFLTVGYVPEKLPFTLDHLKFLQLNYIRFGEIADVSFALCLIKSSPNLKFFDIEVFTSKYDAIGPALKFLEMQDYSDVSFNQLQEVKVQFISGTRPELEFIKLILAKSPLLERMVIEPNSAKVGVRIRRELTRFQCLSPKAELIYQEPYKNTCLTCRCYPF